MKILIIQTAFIGDVILATPLIEKLKQKFPESDIDFLVRKGNETLLTRHPHLRKVLVFDKRKNKYRNLLVLIWKVRAERYEHVINVQRFFTTGILTLFSGAKATTGFDKNPLSVFFTHSVKHLQKSRDASVHEVHRNLALTAHLTDVSFTRPKLYPSAADFEKVATDGEYVCIAPASVWFTKQLPDDRWIELINRIPNRFKIYLLGSKNDFPLCKKIAQQSNSENVEIVAGNLSFLESAALISEAKMTFTNDSAPAHLASAMNAPVTVFYCSTIPPFGFGPLSDDSHVIETGENLPCRPCGIHGKKHCPLGHFKCGELDVGEVSFEFGK